MYEYYVYLKVSEKRLVILNHKIDSEDYMRLMNNSGYDINQLFSLCKIFCLGYIYGTKINQTVINSPEEFL